MNRLLNTPFGKILVSVFMIATLFTSSCAPKTRTKTPLTQSNRSKIKNMAILVEADDDFNVSVEKHGGNIFAAEPGDGLLYGLVFAIPFIIVEIDKYHDDKKHEEALESELVQFSPDEIMSDRLKYHLASSHAVFTAEVTEVKSPDVLKANGFDTILEVNLRGFKVESCLLAPTIDEHLEDEYSRLSKQLLDLERKLMQVQGRDQRYLYSKDARHPNKVEKEILEEAETVRLKRNLVGAKIYGQFPKLKIYSESLVNVRIKLSGRIVLIDDKSTVWEKEELYQDVNCYPLEELKTQPELLLDILTKAIQNLAENTVNEIL